MRVYALFDADGFSPRFYDEASHPPVMEAVPMKPADAPDDLSEAGWPLVMQFARRNDGIPSDAVEIGEAGRAAIVCAPQFHRWTGSRLEALPLPAFDPVP